MQARGVHVPVDDPVRVQVGNRRGQLAEQRERVEGAELRLAELFPRGDVVGALGAENNCLSLVNYLHGRHQVKQVGMARGLEDRDRIERAHLLLRVDARDVHESHHGEALVLGVPLDDNLAVVLLRVYNIGLTL